MATDEEGGGGGAEAQDPSSGNQASIICRPSTLGGVATSELKKQRDRSTTSLSPHTWPTTFPVFSGHPPHRSTSLELSASLSLSLHLSPSILLSASHVLCTVAESVHQQSLRLECCQRRHRIEVLLLRNRTNEGVGVIERDVARDASAHGADRVWRK